MKTYKVVLTVKPIVIAAHNEAEAVAHAWVMVRDSNVQDYVTGQAKEV